MAPDVLGVGETRNTVVNYPLAAHHEAILLGRSLPGLQAGDIARVVKYAQQRPNTDSRDIVALARGTLCPALLHAAAFDQGIRGIILERPLLSYHLVAAHRLYNCDMRATVAGALTAYDLPDLAASCAPRGLLLVDPLDHLGELASPSLFEQEYEFPLEVYRANTGIASQGWVFGRAFALLSVSHFPSHPMSRALGFKHLQTGVAYVIG